MIENVAVLFNSFYARVIWMIENVAEIYISDNAPVTHGIRYG